MQVSELKCFAQAMAMMKASLTMIFLRAFVYMQNSAITPLPVKHTSGGTLMSFFFLFTFCPWSLESEDVSPRTFAPHEVAPRPLFDFNTFSLFAFYSGAHSLFAMTKAPTVYTILQYTIFLITQLYDFCACPAFFKRERASAGCQNETSNRPMSSLDDG